MTAHVDTPIPLVPGGSGSALEAVSERMLAMAKHLLFDGFALLALALMLGVAETIALWFGAAIVAFGLIVVGALIAIAGLVSKAGTRRRH
jgi:hypothetical protein